jgi:alkylhydroperoxidase/carboxymuconolactone decarboxylase family protein YurZ
MALMNKALMRTPANKGEESMTKESIVQAIGVLVFVATVAVAIAAFFYELNTL